MTRAILSSKYAKGMGLEIGPLASCWPVPPGVSVKFMDRLNAKQLSEYWKMDHVTEIDLIDDGNYCATIGDGAFDFVLASHVIEHLPAFIEAIKNWMRVTRPGGYVLMAVPEKNNTFDKPRVCTTWQHLLDEYEQPSLIDANTLPHITEFVTSLSTQSDKQPEIDAFMKSVGDVHYHVWIPETFADALERTRLLLGSFKVVECHHEFFELLIALERI